MASKRLGPLPRITQGVLGRGYGSEGGGALPLLRGVRHLNPLEGTARSARAPRTRTRARPRHRRPGRSSG